MVIIHSSSAEKVHPPGGNMRFGILLKDVWNALKTMCVYEYKCMYIYWAVRKAGLTQAPLRVV